MSLAPGSRLGPYEVLAPLAAGGMGQVYRARDTRLGREVALKMVGERSLGDASALGRFEQEARLAGSLNHPNVLVVFDVGLHQGAPYLVTELLQGETLRDRLAKGAVALGTVLDWAVQMANGLAAAHAQGIVHRDLKPENVFITRSSQVKLLDFGIAKLAAVARGPSSHDLLESTLAPAGGMTGTGAVIGTPRYMSPEQVRGEAVDGRSDLFSFGSVLHEMLARLPAFPGDSAVETGHAILHDEHALLPAEVPLPVAQLVRHCLEKDPEKRFQSARDLAFNLEVLRGPTGSMPAVGVQSSRRRWWWLGLPVAAVGLGLLWAAFRAGPSARQEFPSIRQLTFRRGSVLSARFAPDGRTVYFSASWNGEPPRVYSTTTRSPDYHPLGVDDALLQAVSSTGELAVILHPQSRGFVDGFGTLARVPGVGGAPREVAEDVFGADWAPDGDELAVVREANGRWWLEFPLGHVLYQSAKTLALPRVSPRGDRVALVESDGSDIIVIDRRGQRTLLVERAGPSGLAWAPGGDELWASGGLSSSSSGSLWAVSLAGRRRVLYQGTGSLVLEDVAQDGRALVRDVEDRADVALLNTGSQTVTQHVMWFDGSYAAGLSSDGRSLLLNESGHAAALFSETARGKSSWWVFLQKSDGSPPIRLGEGPGMALSQDGTWALALDPAQASRLWLLPTSAGSPRSRDFPGLTFAGDISQFFRDGKRVALLVTEGASMRAYVVDLESGAAQVVTPPLECCALQLSPDDQFLAAVPHDGGTTAYAIDGGPPRVIQGLRPDDFPVGWSKRGLLVSSDWRLGLYRQPPISVFRLDADKGTRQLLATLSPRDTAGITQVTTVQVTPDEKSVAYTYWIHVSTLYLFKLPPDVREPARLR